MRMTAILSVSLLAASHAVAQTAPPKKLFDIKLSQEELSEIGRLAGKAPFDEVVGLMSDVQSQLNAIGVAENAVAKKATDDAKARERAKIETEMRAAIEEEKTTLPLPPISNGGIP